MKKAPIAKFLCFFVAAVSFPQVLYYFSRALAEFTEASSVAPFSASGLQTGICLICTAFFLFSFFRNAVSYAVLPRERYYLENPAALYKKAGFLLRQRQFLFAFAAFALVYLLLPLRYTFRALCDAFPKGGFWGAPGKLQILFVFLPAFFVLGLSAGLSAVRFWEEDRHRPPENCKKAYQSGAVYITVLYLTAGLFLMAAAPFLARLSPLLNEISFAKTVPVLAFLVSFPFVFRLARAFFKRRAFVRRLRKICFKSGYALSPVQKPYLSLLKGGDRENFHLSDGKRYFSCKLISAPRKNTPLVFYPDGRMEFHFIRRFLKIELSSFVRTKTFAYESPPASHIEQTKILIINPAPKSVFVAQGGKRAPADNGERVGKYCLFAATGFFNALERGFLDLLKTK